MNWSYGSPFFHHDTSAPGAGACAQSSAKGGSITLTPTLAPGSAETYATYVAGKGIVMVTENVQMKWYSTAGSFRLETSGPAEAQVYTLTDNAHLPPPCSIIDLYVVARDARGGTDWLHRQLIYLP